MARTKSLIKLFLACLFIGGAVAVFAGPYPFTSIPRRLRLSSITWDNGTVQVSSPTAGGGGTPANPTTSVQYNNAGAFGGSANFTWDNTNAFLSIGGATAANTIHLFNGGSSTPPGMIFADNSLTLSVPFDLADVRYGPGPSTTGKYQYRTYSIGTGPTNNGGFVWTNSGGTELYKMETNTGAHFHITDTTGTASMNVGGNAAIGMNIVGQTAPTDGLLVGGKTNLKDTLNVTMSAVNNPALTLNGITSQTTDYFSASDSTGRKLSALQSDGTWLIPDAAAGTTDSLTYKTSGNVSGHNTELRIKRTYASQNIGNGTQLAFEDAGNSNIGYLKWESESFIQGRSSLNLYGQVGKVIGLPYNGGIFCFTGGAYEIDAYNNVGGVFSIPSYSYATPGGGTLPRTTTFSIYQSTFETSGGAGPIDNAAGVWIQGAPYINGSNAKIGTYALWIDSGTTRLDGEIQQWLLNSATESVVGSQVQSWDDSTYATRKGRITHKVYDSGGAKTTFYEKADGTSPFVVFPATMTLSAGVTVQAVAPTTGQVLKYDGTNWAPGTDNTGAGGSGYALEPTTVTVRVGSGVGIRFTDSVATQTVSSSYYLFKGTVTVSSNTTTNVISLMPNFGIGTTTISGNTISPGDSLYVVMSGTMSTKTPSPGSLTIFWTVGTSTVCQTPAFTPIAGISNCIWHMNILMTFRSSGASGKVIGNSMFQYYDNVGLALVSQPMTSNGEITIDTTAALKIDAKAQWASSFSSNSLWTNVATILKE